MRVRRTRAVLAGAALAAGLIAASSAAASETVLGGGAQACSVAAKAGQANPQVLENCTLAILGENLSGHLLAATYVNRGTVYMALSNWGSALKDFDLALEVEPTMAEAWVNRGGALVGLKRYKEAEENVDRGLALMPEEPEKAYGNRALARWSQDNLKGAYDDFQMCLMLKPDWEWPKEQLTAFNVETAKVKTPPGPSKP